MPAKVMLEATQSVVSGNAVVVHSGELFEPGARLPDGVTVRPVLADVPDKPKAEDKAAPQAVPEPAKPPAKGPAR